MLETKAILNMTWLVGTALLGVTAGLLYLRGLHREFPWFFRYVLVVLGKAPVLFLLRSDRFAYFYAYWLAETLVAVLSFFVIWEVYRSVAGQSSLRMSRSSFFSLSVGFLAVAALVALFMDTEDSPAILRAILVLTHVARTMQIGLFAVLIVASLFFNLYWKSLPFGITLGYGLYATIELVATVFRASVGPSGDAMFRLSKVLGYQVAILVWIVFLLRHRRGHALEKLPATDIAEWLPAVERPSL
jgi:hypothetical protein